MTTGKSRLHLHQSSQEAKREKEGFLCPCQGRPPLALPKSVEGLGEASVHGFWKDLTDEMVAEFC